MTALRASALLASLALLVASVVYLGLRLTDGHGTRGCDLLLVPAGKGVLVPVEACR